MKRYDIVPRWAVTAACTFLALVYLCGAGILWTKFNHPGYYHTDTYLAERERVSHLDGGGYVPFMYSDLKGNQFWIDLSASSGRTPEQSIAALESFPTDRVARIIAVTFPYAIDGNVRSTVDTAEIPEVLLVQLYGTYFGDAAPSITPVCRATKEYMDGLGLDIASSFIPTNDKMTQLYFYDANGFLLGVIVRYDNVFWYDGWVYHTPRFKPVTEDRLNQEQQLRKDAYDLLWENWSYPLYTDGPYGDFLIFRFRHIDNSVWADYCAYALTAGLAIVICERVRRRCKLGLDAVPFLSAHERLPPKQRLACFAHLYGQAYALWR